MRYRTVSRNLFLSRLNVGRARVCSPPSLFLYRSRRRRDTNAKCFHGVGNGLAGWGGGGHAFEINLSLKLPVRGGAINVAAAAARNASFLSVFLPLFDAAVRTRVRLKKIALPPPLLPPRPCRGEEGVEGTRGEIANREGFCQISRLVYIQIFPVAFRAAAESRDLKVSGYGINKSVARSKNAISRRNNPPSPSFPLNLPGNVPSGVSSFRAFVFGAFVDNDNRLPTSSPSTLSRIDPPERADQCVIV